MPLWALWNGNVRIANSYGWKGHSEVLPHNIWRIEVRRVKNVSEVNILTATQLVKRKLVKVQKLNFLTYFSGIVTHMTHQVIVPIWALINDDIRITNLYDWRAHNDVLPHNFWGIEVRRGWKTCQKLTDHCKPTCEKNCESPKTQFSHWFI